MEPGNAEVQSANVQNKSEIAKLISRMNLRPMLTGGELPGLSDSFGKTGELKILTPHVYMLLKHFDEIRQMPEYEQLVADAKLEEAVVRKMIIYMGGRSEAWRKFIRVSNSTTEQTPPEDTRVVMFVDEIANGMERHSTLGTPDSSKNKLYKQMADDLAKLNINRAEVHRGPNLTVPPEHSIDPESSAEEALEVLENDPVTPELLAAGAQFADYLEDQKDPRNAILGAVKRQENFKENILGRLPEAGEIKDSDLPEIVILRGVGQTQENWQARMEFYQKKGIKCRFIDWPKFEKGMTFAGQADWLKEQLIAGGYKGGQKFAFEAHSWGGLVLTHFMAKNPEMVSHAIVTGSPTRSDNDPYHKIISGLFKMAADHPNETRKLIGLIVQSEKINTILEKIPNLTQRIDVSALKFFLNTDIEEDFRVYSGHYDSSWKFMADLPWTIAKYLLYGEKDSAVNLVGRGAAELVKGAVLAVNPDGGHDPIGDPEIALELHKRLYAESLRRADAII